jgi:hypothetical protein
MAHFAVRETLQECHPVILSSKWRIHAKQGIIEHRFPREKEMVQSGFTANVQPVRFGGIDQSQRFTC